MRKYFFLGSLVCCIACNNNKQPEKPVHVDSGQNVAINLKQDPNPYVDVDISPMDMSYYPSDYPMLKMQHLNTQGPIMRLIYSRPLKLNRKIFGGLLPYGKQWRLGANEASEIEFFKPVLIDNKKVSPGRYVIYCIPQPDSWTIVLNSDIFTWGKEIDAGKDLFHFKIPVENSKTACEHLTMYFQSTTPGSAQLFMAWDMVTAKLNIQLVTVTKEN